MEIYCGCFHGRLYALDMWAEGLKELRKRISASGINNIETIQADIRMEEIDVQAVIGPFGFQKVLSCDVGEFNYLLTFQKTATGG